MATFNERIQVVIDVVTNKATAGLKDFRGAVTEAQGFTGKLKAGVGALKDQFAAAATSPAGLTAAVTAGATIAARAVRDYADLGVQIGDFATATGLATEDASRWVEVAGDLGIEAGTLQSSIGKLNKSIDPKLFADLGVEISRTSAGAVDVNNTFLNVIDRLRAIKDPAEQARVGAQLLGKGWQSVAPLIGRSASEIRSRLEDVASVKVFSEADTKKARQFDAAMKDLQDATQELALRLGQELLPVVNGIVEPIANLTGAFGDLKDSMGPFGMSGLEAFNTLSESTGGLIDDLRGVSEPIQYTGKAITDMGDAAAQSARYSGMLAAEQKRVADNSNLVEDSMKRARGALKDLQDQIKGRNDLVDLVVDLDDIKVKLDEIAKAHADGEISDREYWLQAAQLTGDAQQAVADYVSALDKIPDPIKTDLILTFDPNAPEKFFTKLQAELSKRNVTIGVVPGPIQPGPQDGPNTGRRPRSTMTSSTTPAVPGNVTINVTAPVGASQVEIGRGVHDALQSYYRNGGGG